MEGKPPIVEQPTNYRAVSPLTHTPSANSHLGHPSQAGLGRPLQLIPMPPFPGVPIGLEPLINVDHIFVRQMVETLEVFSGFETSNRYNVLNGNGQRIFFAAETTDCCERSCKGRDRQFVVVILDFYGRAVLTLKRIDSACCCIGGDMLVTLGDGTRLGQVTQSNRCSAEFDVTDATGASIMMITGPNSADCCTGAADYPITTKAGLPLGIIRKSFAGFIQEYFTDADNFGVEFPQALDVRWKALMFAAVFLIDFLYYERSGGRHQY